MRSLVLAASILSLCVQSFSQTTPPSPSYDGEAFVVEQADTLIQYNPDGTGKQTLHLRVKVQNEAGVKQFSVVGVPYAGASQAATLEKLRVTHPDGSVVETPPSEAMELPAPVTQQAPLYSDVKVLQVPVRGLRPGDTLEYGIDVAIQRAEAPSQFWGVANFDKNAVVLEQTVRLDVPAKKYVQVWSPEQKPTVSVKDGRRVYSWSYRQLQPTSQQKKEDAAGAETKPSIAWTTFHNWAEVGDWYRSLTGPRAAPTDALRAQAESLTKDIKSPQDQVEALYSFVSTHVRYVGVDFGIGRYEPHSAAEVLANQYGDCKDKDTLLEALLRAKGFQTAPALIGANVEMIPELPSPGLFNHVITTVTLPTGRIWMDSTPEVAPFRLLMAQLRDKQALVIPAEGAATLERTPAEPPYPFTDTFHGSGTISADGELKGHIEITDRSDGELGYRTLARNLAPAQWDQGAQYIANLLGFSGTVSNANFARADDLSVPMRISYDYSRKPFGDWDNFRIVPLYPVGVDLPAAPDKQPTAAIDLGAPRTEEAISELKLAPRFTPNLPDAVHVQTAFATLDKSYSFAGGLLTIKRIVVIRQEKVPASSWQDYAKFVKDSGIASGETFIQLLTPGSAAAAPPQSNGDAAGLVAMATEYERAQEWSNAQKELDAAKALAPEQPYLWSSYGYVAMRQGRADEAKADFEHELAHHPEESRTAVLYALFLRSRGEEQEAIPVLERAYQRDPAGDRVALVLASLQAESSVTDAIATLRGALKAKPADEHFSIALASYLVRDHQMAAVAPLLKPVLEATSDPGLLNDASYVLAESGEELPLAEAKARAAIALLDAGSTINVAEADPQSFERASLLISSWDTLGYILMQEGRYDEARPYLSAAWKNRPSPTIGEHYGEELEQLHHPDEALRVYELAASPHPRKALGAENQQVEDAIERLKKAGASASIPDPARALQEARTFRYAATAVPAKFVSATFRLQLTAEGIGAGLLVNGDPALDKDIPRIERIPLPQLVPAGSTAHLLRDAVVSCSAGEKECELVLMPMGLMAAEHP